MDYEKALRVVRRNLPAGIRSVYDPEDFVQDACVKVLLGANPNLLTRIATHRMINAYRRPDRKRRVGCEPSEIEAVQSTSHAELEAIELKENLSLNVNDDERAMIRLAAEGYSRVEIAARVGCMPYVVQLFLGNLNKTCA
jgi:DNA-directed RNA polymerase specialized sigma24 family protein